jgi:hypothetical protein
MQLHIFLPSALDAGEQSALHPGYFIPWCPTDNRLRLPQSRYECCGEDKTYPLPKTEPRSPDCPACSLVTILTELPQFLP